MSEENPDPTPDLTPDPTPAPQSFSQADVDRIVQDRVARERKKYEGFDDFKAKAAKFDEHEAASASELEKAQAAVEREKTRADKATADLQAGNLRSAFVAEAAKPDRRVISVDAAFKLLDTSKLEIENDGTPKDIAKAVDTLLAENQFLVIPEGARPGGADQGARGGGAKQLSQEALKGMSPEEIVKARREGRLDTLLSGK